MTWGLLSRSFKNVILEANTEEVTSSWLLAILLERIVFPLLQLIILMLSSLNEKIISIWDPPNKKLYLPCPSWSNFDCLLDHKQTCLTYTENESLFFFLSISEPPSFVRELGAADVVKGSSACFDCQVAGTAPFKITWHKDAKEIKPSAKHGFSQKNGTMGLEVHKCDSVDVGEYQCTVANEVGSCTCKTTLNLKGWSDQNPYFHMSFEVITDCLH